MGVRTLPLVQPKLAKILPGTVGRKEKEKREREKEREKDEERKSDNNFHQVSGHRQQKESFPGFDFS